MSRTPLENETYVWLSCSYRIHELALPILLVKRGLTLFPSHRIIYGKTAQQSPNLSLLFGTQEKFTKNNLDYETIPRIYLRLGKCRTTRAQQYCDS